MFEGAVMKTIALLRKKIKRYYLVSVCICIHLRICGHMHVEARDTLQYCSSSTIRFSFFFLKIYFLSLIMYVFLHVHMYMYMGLQVSVEARRGHWIP